MLEVLKNRWIGTVAALLLAGTAALAAADPGGSPGRLLAEGLLGASGASVGPDGALYVVEGAAGKITRIDPRNGRKKTFAEGLPPAFDFVGIGGAMDVAFIGKTAYVLVSLVGEFGGGPDGVYRVDGRNTFTLIADVGTWSATNPPPLPFDLFHGVQFAMEPAGDGFLVSDGHHNRVIHVSLDGTISTVKQYGNTVPTGLEGAFGTAYVAEFGAVPNPPESGKVVTFGLLNPSVDGPTLASGVPMIVDVEFGPDGRLYALSQGDIAVDVPGAPALPNTGRLLKVLRNGQFKVLATGLDRPTSLNFVCDDALVVTLPGEVRRFKNLAKHKHRCGGHCN